MNVTRWFRTALVAAPLAVPGQAAAQSFASLSQAVRDFVALPETTFAIVGVRLVDGTGLPARDGMTIVVRAGRIIEVGPSARVTVPAGIRVVDGALQGRRGL